MPFYARKIYGRDQIIGCGDTGVDVDNCFFYDPDHPVQYYYSPYDEVVPSAHNKIAGYVAYADDGDEYGGHGTHVTGSIAGGIDKTNPWTMFHGAAPEARLSFFDMGGEHGIIVPDSMFDFFPIAYSMGARIHSVRYAIVLIM